MKKTFKVALGILLCCVVMAPFSPAFAQDKPYPLLNTSLVDSASSGFRIDQPGTITFTVGIKIKGKVEKPQVMIFLPKERTYYRELDFSHSFENDLTEPLPQIPLIR